jgi:prolyl oligopeptidase
MNKLITIFSIMLSLYCVGQKFECPVTQKNQVKDTFFAKIITDDYRWLENQDDPEVKEWIDQQDDYTAKALKKPALKVNSYVAIDKYSYVKYSNPQKHGDYYFTYGYYNNVGVPALFFQSGLRDNPAVLVDPNFISNKDDIFLKGYSVSMDSKLLAFQFSRNGSDWGEIMIVRTNTGQYLDDHLQDIKYSSIAWKGEGFYYSRFPAAGLRKTTNQEVYYH